MLSDDSGERSIVAPTEPEASNEQNAPNPSAVSLAIRPSAPSPIPSFSSIAWAIANLGSSMAISDTYAIKGWLLQFYLGFLNNDEHHLAAAGLISAVINFCLVTACSPLFILSVICPEKLAELERLEENTAEYNAKKEELMRYFQGCLYYSGLASIPVMTIMYHIETILVNGFKQDPITAGIAGEFLQPYSLVVPATFLQMCLAEMLQSAQAKNALRAGFGCLIASLSLASALGFGKLGLPNKGLQGILTGYILEPYITSCVFLAFLIKQEKLGKIPFFKRFLEDWQANRDMVWTLLKKGAGLSFSILSMMILAVGISTIAGRCGTMSQANLAMTLQYTLLNDILSIHFPLAGMIFLGTRLASKNFPLIKKTALAGIVSSSIIGSIIPAFFALFPRVLLTLTNTDNPQMARTLDRLAPISSSAAAMEVIRSAFLFQLRTMGDMWGSTGLYMSSQFLGLCLALVLGLGTDTAEFGIAAAYSISCFIGCLMLALRWQSKLHAIEAPAAPAAEGRPASFLTNFCIWSRQSDAVVEVNLSELDQAPNP